MIRPLKMIGIDLSLLGSEEDVGFFVRHLERLIQQRGDKVIYFISSYFFTHQTRHDFLQLLLNAHSAELDVKDNEKVSWMDQTDENAGEYADWKDVGKKGK